MEYEDRLIFRRFRVRHDDILPYKSYGGNRDMLGPLSKELGYKLGAEIGVMRGAFSRSLLGANPDLTMKCIDPWTPFGSHTQETMDKYYRWACRRLRHFKAEIIRKTSLDALTDIPDGSLDFVYIDQMHEFDPTMLDLIHWSAKVRIGGIVAGHDFEHYYHLYGVVQAVEAYTHAHHIDPWYVTTEPHPSFFWIKRK